MAATKYLNEFKSKGQLIEKAREEESQAKTMLGCTRFVLPCPAGSRPSTSTTAKA